MKKIAENSEVEQVIEHRKAYEKPAQPATKQTRGSQEGKPPGPTTDLSYHFHFTAPHSYSASVMLQLVLQSADQLFAEEMLGYKGRDCSVEPGMAAKLIKIRYRPVT